MKTLAALRRGPSLTERSSRWWVRQPSVVRIALALGLLLVAVLYPRTISQSWQSILFNPVALYVLLALGLNIVVGYAGLLDLGYVAFYAVGAYTAAKLTTTVGWGAWEALPVAVAAAMVAGVALGAPTLRLRGDYLAIVTLGFGEIVYRVALNSESLGETRGITGIPHPASLPGLEFGFAPLPYYYLTLAAIVLTLLVLRRLRQSRVGRAWAATREDEDAAEAMGVPTFTMKLWAFAMGAFTGGLAGWIYAGKSSFISPDNFPFFFSVLILSAVVLGGMGSLPGTIAGAFAVAFLPEYLREAAAGETLTRGLNALIGARAGSIVEYRVFLFGAALVVMMIFRPQGLLPSRQRAAELVDTPLDAGPEDQKVTEEPTQQVTERHEEPVVSPDRREPSDTDVVLELSGLTIRFGGVEALRDVSLAVRRREIFAIIGPNGAGKTTLFNCVTGMARPSGGDVRLRGRSVLGSRSPHSITRAGIARTFQSIRLFPDMTALENVLVGTDAHHATSVPGAVAGLPRHRREERHGMEEAERLLEFVGVAGRRRELARNLPYGDQRRLEIARAMATAPAVLLLDEPGAGMNPSEKQGLISLVGRIRDTGLTVLLIEHDMGVVMNLADRVAVLDFGQKIAEGPPAEIQRDPRVIEAYLGGVIDAP